MSTKREELQRILNQFNIQVDNPVAILTQETSRNFLHSKSAQDRYKVGLTLVEFCLHSVVPTDWVFFLF